MTTVWQNESLQTDGDGSCQRTFSTAVSDGVLTVWACTAHAVPLAPSLQRTNGGVVDDASDAEATDAVWGGHHIPLEHNPLHSDHEFSCFISAHATNGRTTHASVKHCCIARRPSMLDRSRSRAGSHSHSHHRIN